MKMIKASLFSVAILFVSVAGWAQCKEFKWPADKAKAEESLAIWGDALKQGHFRAATAPLQWMLTNAPDWNTKLYVEAAQAYDGLASKETDAAKKKVLVDSLMLIYDMRLKYCGDEVNVINRKAASNVKFNINDKTKSVELLGLYDRVYEISGNNVNDNNLEAYMSVIYVNFMTQKNLNEDQIFQRYDKLISVIDFKIAKAQQENKTADVDRYKKIKSNVDDKLIKMVKVDCAFVKKNLEPKFKANPTDVGMAKKIFEFMLKDKCTDDPLWVEAAELVHKTTPDFALAKVLGAKYLQNKSAEKAEPLLTEAMTLATTPADKAEVSVLLGDMENTKGNKTAARENYRKASGLDPANKDGFEKIGDLYYFSFNDCKKGQSLAEDRLVYLAAYEMYAKAGNQQKMAQAKSQFPSVTELFELNWKEGDSKKITCWVGETVVLRTRGKE